jgi:trk system potassium uptake protein TrkH
MKHSAFQVAAIISTTGYSTVDFNQWPELSKTIIIILMFVGGCAGSTAGGLKVSRIILMFKTVKRDLRRLVHPRSVNTVRLEGKSVDNDTISSVGGYIIIYMIIFFATFLVLSFSQYSFLENFTATATCINNIGPGLGAVGPASNFSGYSYFHQLVLSFTMLLGRLEIFPILLAFAPSTWRKK